MLTEKRNPVPALLLLLMLCLLPGLAPAGEPLTFAVIGDTRIGLTESVYTAFIKKMEEQKIQTIFITGDAIDRPGSRPEWERFLEITGKEKTLYVVPGNHDVHDTASLSVYTKLFNKPPYHSFTKGDTIFILLNSEMPDQWGRITGEQFEWLKTELKKPFAYKLVFLHRPLFPTTFGTLYGLDRHKSERDRLHDLLVENGVTLVVMGHEHLYDRTKKDGITYVITGGGGARLLTYSDQHGGFFHYLIAKRENGGYLFTVYDMRGNIRDEFPIKR